MTSSRWGEPVTGPPADEIADLNRQALIHVVFSLVTNLLERQRRRGWLPVPGEAALLELHGVATRFVLRRPGRYRKCSVHVDDPDRDFVLHGAPHREIPRLMRLFFRDLRALWKTGDALDVAAFALWRIAFIHPFEDGNGRTADAFAHACLCLKLGALLPARANLMQAIQSALPEYWRTLTLAHRTASAGGRADLGPLKEYLDAILLDRIRALEAGHGG